MDDPDRCRIVLLCQRRRAGRQWLLRTGQHLPPPRVAEVHALLLEHLDDHYAFYGTHVGVRSARKHLIWYTRRLEGGDEFCARMNRLDDCDAQRAAVDGFLREHGGRNERLAYSAVVPTMTH